MMQPQHEFNTCAKLHNRSNNLANRKKIADEKSKKRRYEIVAKPVA